MSIFLCDVLSQKNYQIKAKPRPSFCCVHKLLCCLLMKTKQNKKLRPIRRDHLSTKIFAFREVAKEEENWECSECRFKDWLTARFDPTNCSWSASREVFFFREGKVTRNIIQLICCSEPRSFVSPGATSDDFQKQAKHIFEGENCTINVCTINHEIVFLIIRAQHVAFLM